MAYFSPVTSGLDLTYKYDCIRPIHNNKIIEPRPGTLWDFLVQNKKEFRLFKYLVEIAQLENIFNDVQLNITVFIPEDKNLLKFYPENMILNMEKYQALKIINYNSLPRKIDIKEISSSKSMKLNTKIRGHLIYTNAENGIINLIGEFNNSVKILKGDIIVNNALIHITDKILLPEM